MSDDNTQGAAEPSSASAGSQPVAWAVEFDGDEEPYAIFFRGEKAVEEAGGTGRVFPLYRQPQPTLTDSEREAICLARSVFDENYRMSPSHNAADEVLERLLDRA